jgi:hypothetical protein
MWLRSGMAQKSTSWSMSRISLQKILEMKLFVYCPTSPFEKLKKLTWTAFTFEHVINLYTSRVVLAEAHIAQVLHLVTIRALEIHSAHTLGSFFAFLVHADRTVAIRAHELITNALLDMTMRAFIVRTTHTRSLGLITIQSAVQVALGANGRHFTVLSFKVLVAYTRHGVLFFNTFAVVFAWRGARLTWLLLSACFSHVAT